MLEGVEVKRRRRSHIFDREEHDFYVEPQWCSTRLFEVEEFNDHIWDPACGMGRILGAARSVGLRMRGTDIMPRGAADYQADFLDPNRWSATRELRTCKNIVTNPPFDLSREFAEQALKLATCKVAMIFPTRRLNAATWLERTPLARVWLMTPRPSMGPGSQALKGIEARGDTKDYCWLVWDNALRGNSLRGEPVIRWLHRDEEGVHRGRGRDNPAHGEPSAPEGGNS